MTGDAGAHAPGRLAVQRRRRCWAAVVGALTVAGATGSCTSTTEQDALLPPPPTVVRVEMGEYRFSHRSEIPSSRVVFRVANGGQEDHDLALARLPEDLPPLDEQLRSPNRRPLVTVRLLPRFAPGEHGAFAVDLPPGRYGFVCAVPSPDGQTHAQKGMSSELRVR